MTLAISLSAEAEQQLAREARREGIDISTLAARVLEAAAARLAGPADSKPNQATLDLLHQWAKEEQTTDPAEILRSELEVTEFMEGINRDRTDFEGSNARKIFP